MLKKKFIYPAKDKKRGCKMESEQVRIFNENREAIGIASRDEVHREGYWHEVFQCWFVRIENGVRKICFQLRSDRKKDFPGLYDITAAGHLMADESVEDGVREVEEELGIGVSYDELTPLKVIKASIKKDHFFDNEIANIFLYECNQPLEKFKLQKEEVSGIVQADFDQFYELWLGERDEVDVKGFCLNDDGERINVNEKINKLHFVPHEISYYQSVVKEIEKNFTQS